MFLSLCAENADFADREAPLTDADFQKTSATISPKSGQSAFSLSL
jgi:hypothetical protein